jgi:hypothetical protein
MRVFHFIFQMLKNPILKVELSIIFWNDFTFIRCPILQNGLNLDEILIFWKFQVNGALKDIYVVSNYVCYKGPNMLLGTTSSVITIQFYISLNAKSSQYLNCLVNVYNNVFNTLWKHLKKLETNLMNLEYPKTFF